MGGAAGTRGGAEVARMHDEPRLVAASAGVAREWVPVVDEVLQGTSRARTGGRARSGRADALEADVSGVCTPGDAGALLCSERVSLSRAARCRCACRASCAALSVTDVPTTLVWLGRAHADDPVFAALASRRHANRARRLARLARGARGRRLLAAHQGAGRAARCGGPHVGAAFHVAGAVRADLRRAAASAAGRGVTRVTIVQDGSAGAVLGTQGTLLLGWLATRLGWKAASLAGKLRLVRRDGGTITSRFGRREVRATRARFPPGLRSTLEAPTVSVHGEMEREGTPRTGAWRSRSGSSEPQRIEQRVRLRDERDARPARPHPAPADA